MSERAPRVGDPQVIARIRSRLGTETNKNFMMLPKDQALTTLPTGVWQYERREIRALFPQIGALPSWWFYHMRIGCCSHLVVAGANKLQDCERCQNRGWVCPLCVGDRWLSAPGWTRDNMVRCPGCVYQRVNEKREIEGTFDVEMALESARRWLAHRFPYAVPLYPTPQDLALMDLC